MKQISKVVDSGQENLLSSHKQGQIQCGGRKSMGKGEGVP